MDEMTPDKKTLSRLARLETRAMLIEERLATLEAKPTPKPEYVPGWEDASEFGSFYTGIGTSRYVDQAIRFHMYTSATIVNMMCDFNLPTISLTANELRNLIGAAMAILEVMESESS